MKASIKRSKMLGVLDPRICNTILDANAIDPDGGPKDPLIDRLLTLQKMGEITIVVPGSVRREIEHPRTPNSVKNQILPMIFSLSVGKTVAEHETIRNVRSLLRGNASTGKHDADGFHLCEAAKYGGGYFITHDGRMLDKRAELKPLLGPALCIVTLSEFLEVYDRFKATRALVMHTSLRS